MPKITSWQFGSWKQVFTEYEPRFHAQVAIYEKGLYTQ